MSSQSDKSFPIPSVQRLPVYFRFLKEQQNRGEVLVSCTRIAEEFGQLSVQVRKDLSITGISGRPKVGYRVDELIDAIETFLGWNEQKTAYLVGVGSLGSAILGYEGFSEHGLNIVAAFDTDPNKIGRIVHGCPVYDSQDMLKDVQDRCEHRIDIGILTVPSSVAQETASRLVQIDVKAIWNYTPVRLELPPDIICEDVKLSASFAVLSSRLNKKAPSQNPTNSPTIPHNRQDS